ncbi:hypothetical protein GGR60_000617 [Xanthomonas arboricola]|nr:hypothetical protein [Xanthomonas euroxanthea]
MHGGNAALAAPGSLRALICIHRRCNRAIRCSMRGWASAPTTSAGAGADADAGSVGRRYRQRNLSPDRHRCAATGGVVECISGAPSHVRAELAVAASGPGAASPRHQDACVSATSAKPAAVHGATGTCRSATNKVSPSTCVPMLLLSAHVLSLSAPHPSAVGVLALLDDRCAALWRPMREAAGDCAVLCASDRAAMGVARGGAWSTLVSNDDKRPAMRRGAMPPVAAAQSQAVC